MDADDSPGHRPGPLIRHGGGSRPAVWARLALLAALLAAVTTLAVLVGLPDLAALRSSVATAGPAAPAVFVLIYDAAALTPLPKNVLGVLAGLLFGLPVGTLVVLLAAMLGSTVAYGLGRALGRGAVEKITGARIARVDALLRRRGILAVIAVRDRARDQRQRIETVRLSVARRAFVAGV